jgi:hypothetical protein
MKILIISSGRSGSTTLYNALVDNLNNSIGVFEPLNPTSRDYTKNINKLKAYPKLVDKNNFENLIEKHLIFDIVNGHYSRLIYNKVQFLDPLEFNYNIVNKFYIKYIKNYDKVILLKRNNIDELAHSWYYARKNDVYFQPYQFKNIEDKDFLKTQYFLSKQYNSTLTNLNILTKLPIILYEDLFSGDKNYIKYFLKIYNIKVNNFESFCNYFNPKYRYKQT